MLSAAVHVVGIYRRRNAQLLRALLEPGARAGWSTALWALDESHPDLAASTVGSGSGGKFDLLNALLLRRPAGDEQWLCVVDDDVVLKKGLPHLVTMVERAGLDLAQPAHARSSRASHDFTRRRSLALARLTSFVEIGPVMVVSPAWVPRLTPFPSGQGMGWGLELTWRAMVQQGCRLGIVDASPVVHPDAPNSTYTELVHAEHQRLQQSLEREGLSHVQDAQQVLATWYRWQRRPSWCA